MTESAKPGRLSRRSRLTERPSRSRAEQAARGLRRLTERASGLAKGASGAGRRLAERTASRAEARRRLLLRLTERSAAEGWSGVARRGGLSKGAGGGVAAEEAARLLLRRLRAEGWLLPEPYGGFATLGVVLHTQFLWTESVCFVR